MSLHVHDLLAYLSAARPHYHDHPRRAEPHDGPGANPCRAQPLGGHGDHPAVLRGDSGTVRYATSVLKKRFGDHERTIREHRIGPNGLALGEPLAQFRGVLLASPEYVGEEAPLL